MQREGPVEVVDKGGSWTRLWDSALHLGTWHTDGLNALSRMLAHHGHGSKLCPQCDENNLVPNPIGHLLRVHQHEIGMDRTPVDSVDQLVTQLVNCNIQVFSNHSESLTVHFVPLVGLYR